MWLVYIGNGIINADGELWRIQRKAGLRFFSNANLKAFVNEVLPPFLEDTKRTLHEVAKQGEVVDLQNVLLEFTTRLMGKMAYDVGCSKQLFHIYCPAESCRPDVVCWYIDGHAWLSPIFESF